MLVASKLMYQCIGGTHGLSVLFLWHIIICFCFFTVMTVLVLPVLSLSCRAGVGWCVVEARVVNFCG